MILRESLSQNIAYMLCSAHVTLVSEIKAQKVADCGMANSLARSAPLLWFLWVVGMVFVRMVWGYGAERYINALYKCKANLIIQK